MTWEQFEGQLDNPVMEALVLKMMTATFLRPFCSTKFNCNHHDQAYFKSIDLSVTEARS